MTGGAERGHANHRQADLGAGLEVGPWRCGTTLKAWHALAKAASWRHPKEIKARFPGASFLANNRVMFNIGSNKHRLVIKVDDEFQAIYIRFIGTHADYDKIEASSI